MLASMPPGKFNERLAHYFIEPWGDDAKVASAVGAQIINEIRVAVTSSQSQVEYLEPDHFLPKREDIPEPAEQQSVVGMFRRQYGG